MKNPSSALHEEQVLGVGGLKICVRSWSPAGRARAVVVMVPGFNSHGYGWVAEQLTRNGFAVYAFDPRDRGKSVGERFYVEKFADYTSDVGLVVSRAKAREAGLPVFLLGLSSGGVIACMYTIDNQAQLAGLICESFACAAPAPDFGVPVLKGLRHIAPHAHILRARKEDSVHEAAAVEAPGNGPLIHEAKQQPRTTAGNGGPRWLDDRHPLISLPVLILHGSHDKASTLGASQFFYDSVDSTYKALKLYDGHYHGLLNDVDKELVMAETTTWITGRLRKAAPVAAHAV